MNWDAPLSSTTSSTKQKPHSKGNFMKEQFTKLSAELEQEKNGAKARTGHSREPSSRWVLKGSWLKSSESSSVGKNSTSWGGGKRPPLPPQTMAWHQQHMNQMSCPLWTSNATEHRPQMIKQLASASWGRMKGRKWIWRQTKVIQHRSKLCFRIQWAEYRLMFY